MITVSLETSNSAVGEPMLSGASGSVDAGGAARTAINAAGRSGPAGLDAAFFASDIQPGMRAQGESGHLRDHSTVAQEPANFCPRGQGSGGASSTPPTWPESHRIACPFPSVALLSSPIVPHRRMRCSQSIRVNVFPRCSSFPES